MNNPTPPKSAKTNHHLFREWIAHIQRGGAWEKRLANADSLTEVRRRGGQKTIAAMEAAATALYVHFAPQLTRFIQSRIDSGNVFTEDIQREMIQDICHEVLTAVILSIKKGNFDAAKGTLPSMVFGIAKNKINDGLAKIYRETHEKVSIDRQLQSCFERIDEELAVEKKLRKAELHNAIDSLRHNPNHARHWQALKLKFVHDYSNEQIMAEMSLASPAEAASLLHYGKSLLKRLLKASDFIGILAIASYHFVEWLKTFGA